MALPDYLLKTLFPRLGISKVIIEGEESKINLSIEFEVLEKYSPNRKMEVNSGFFLISTDEDFASIGDISQEFKNAVYNKTIVDFSNYGNIEEKIINEANKTLLSRTLQAILPSYNINKNIAIIYGSWIENQSNRTLSFSPINTEIIFENNKIKSESNIFLLQGTQDIWDGPVVRSEDRLSFFTNETTPRQLDKYLVKNYKIQDFRVKKQIEKYITDYTDINSKIANATSKSFIRQQKKKYFTDLYISQKDYACLSFGINFRDILLENSILGKDANVSFEIQKDLFLKSKILDIKVLKRKVKFTGKNTHILTNTNNSVDLFPGSLERVISSGHDTDEGFSSDLYLKENANILEKMNNKMRFFSCIDMNIEKNENSICQYGVRLEIMDGSYKIAIQDIQEMQDAVNKLQTFYSNMFEFILSNGSSGSLYTEEQVEYYVDLYLKKISKYYRLEQYLEIKNKLISSLSPVNLDTSSLENFINLYQTFISNLENFVGNKANIFDDPHIIDDINPQQNTKNTFFVEYYFTNNIYDMSLIDTKKVEYLQKSGDSFFNEYRFADLNFGSRITINKRSSEELSSADVVPLSLSYQNGIISKNGITKKNTIDTEEQQEQFSKIIRQNLLNYINIDITKKYLKQVEQNQMKREEREEYIYEQDISEMYKYFSSTNSKNKEIDEIIDIYPKYESQFESRIQFLADYSSFTGEETWIGIENLPRQSLINKSGTILCRLKPKTKDYRQTSWDISENVRLLDTYFLIYIEDIQDLQSSYSSIFASTYSSNQNTRDLPKKENSNNKTAQKLIADAVLDVKNTNNTRVRQTNQRVDIKQNEIKEQIDKNFKKIKNSIGNRILNG